ncbi:MAG TPA: MBL fold metallo-hydrolase [Gaiellaceae bacterium]|nr:MBL fold metallo-hydrolase [Gaiellaceae bacterium]
MFLRQFVDDDLGCASYLIGDEEAGEAVLVDPAFAVEPFVAEAASRGLRITRVLETHTHADHVSGHGRLALERGVPVAVHRDAGAEYPHDRLEDGTEVPVGSVIVRTLHTPGHRPEHCCFLAGDALLTGDSLFVGTAARPDLAVEAREGAEGLFHSLRRLLELPDDVRVMPGHVAGSLCGTGMSDDTSSTIGRERRFNPALALATVEEFVTDSASVTTPRPPNMERIVDLNRGAFVAAPASLAPVARDGHFVLDVRNADAHAAGHVPGAINVPVSGSSFGTKAGFLIPSGATIALHAQSADQAERAAAKLHAVGFLELAGYLDEPSTPETIDPIELDELERLVTDGAVEVIDVREPYERDAGYIPGSRNIPYRVIGELADDLADGKPLVTVCESGARAGIAASVLAATGVRARPVLHGGIYEWQRRGGQLVEFRRCGS